MIKPGKYLLPLIFLIAGCSSMTVSEKEQKRSELDTMAKETIASLVEQNSNIQIQIDDAMAFAVADMKLTKVPVVGGGGGEGVFVDNSTQKHVYFTVTLFDIGGGWGVRAY